MEFYKRSDLVERSVIMSSEASTRGILSEPKVKAICIYDMYYGQSNLSLGGRILVGCSRGDRGLIVRKSAGLL